MEEEHIKFFGLPLKNLWQYASADKDRHLIIIWNRVLYKGQNAFIVQKNKEEVARKMMMTQEPNHKRRYNYNDDYLQYNSIPISTSVGFDFENNMASKRLKSVTGTGSLPPKEKKDKFGEKIAALQKLVSPFGKTDTASVLQEASGYIKFLHEQIQVLSSPYLMSSLHGDIEDPEYYNLRNRGLCLMPVDLTLPIARSNGADLWAPINSRSRSSN